MKHYNLIGGPFQHAHCSTWWKVPELVKWHYESDKYDESVYVDLQIRKGVDQKDDGKRKFGWILESRFISHSIVNDLLEHLPQYKEAYEFILTHYKPLLDLDPEFFKWCPAYAHAIEEPGLHPKKKLCSMITSNKTFTEQQVYRVGIANKFKDKIDLLGRGFNPIDKKEEGLIDYMFSIAIENDSYESYFTEKITDCFACGTVPIYKGTPDIGDFFNLDGIIILDEDFTPDQLSADLYTSKKDAIKDNYERTRKVDILDDWIYNTYLKHYGNN